MPEYVKQKELVDSQGLKIIFIYCIFNFEYQRCFYLLVCPSLSSMEISLKKFLFTVKGIQVIIFIENVLYLRHYIENIFLLKEFTPSRWLRQNIDDDTN